ncbi:type I restriction enzyme HsdR N-terminal domain-containing protein [Leptodesmis sichuanensis]|uniref:type I restriction enzyme HsdR N-terminal domain-containing protein n=1 Tax=Leptodesmis sichuanensis TaxID=2906798 RepID=UPI001F40CED0|nr:type I restriction enzyme HsdR N-terminal domain-containing protein [Leptodesmis sichuanensis]UIE39114.1 restriction endonuclease subunit R [Leptodesmis sichuanensis A121]
MTPAISASDLTLRQVKQQFGLVQVNGTTVAEWQPPFPEPSDLERQILDRVQTNYAYLSERSLAEGLVNMVVVSPLLDLAGFYQPPFDVDIEFDISIPIQAETDEHTLVKGRIDVLVVKNKLWILVIESKRTRFDVMEALPQALAYMMGCPTCDYPLFGLSTNGCEFLFIQLMSGQPPQYALSRRFSMDNPGQELYAVLSILKRIGATLLP